MTYVAGVATEGPDVVLAHKTHGALKLSVEDVNELGNTILAVDVGEVERTADTDGGHAERDESEHVRSVADTTVGVDLDLAEDFGVIAVEIEENLNGGNTHVDLAATVVGDVDGREAEVGAELDVVSGLDALGDDGQVGHLADFVQDFNAGIGCVAGAGGSPVAVVARTDTFDTGVVNSDENSAEAIVLHTAELVLQAASVLPDVLLVEHDLAFTASATDLLNVQCRGDGRHVEDVGITGGSDEVPLGIGVGVTSLSGRCNEERRVELVAQNPCLPVEVGHVLESEAIHPDLLPVVHVSFVGDLVQGTGTVVSIAAAVQLVLSCELEVVCIDDVVDWRVLSSDP